MIAIADSGTTKTSWLFVNKDGSSFEYKTVGFNPYYQTPENIYNNLKDGLIPNISSNEPLEKIFFYGAGCEQMDKREEVANGISKAFPNTELHINHDLLAAAKALFGDEKGIACIAGTGANSCYYDGIEVVRNIHSLGLFLGDEGSGGFNGKLLVSDYIRENMPANIRAKFEVKYTDRGPEILDNVYTKPFPSRYLASFMPFIAENISDPYIYQLAYKNFAAQFDACIMKYENVQNLSIGYIGSVAFYLQDVLQQVAKDRGVKVTKIIRNPLKDLADYHLKKGLV